MGLCTGQTARVAAHVGVALALPLVLGALGLAPGANAQDGAAATKPKLGLSVNDPRACKGYTLLAPSTSTNTYLIDMEGRVVRTWKSDCNPGLSAYLLENGHLLRTGSVRNPPFFGGGAGGRIQEFTWDGKLVWDFTYVSDTQLPNHDICRLPNGNVLMIVWEKKPAQDATAAGRRPETVSDGYLLAGALLEVQPTGERTGKVVWEWHTWDHLVQDFDAAKANYGDVAAHPELIDVNFGDATIAAMVARPQELEKLRAIGYVGGPAKKPQRAQTDWLHINAVAYNADLDQIMLSVYEFSEIWIIDHGTTTAEAAGHKGGRSGKGGDLLYRWGNPRAYRAGTLKDQKLFGQHNAHWIAKGLPGEGHALIFNNGLRRIGGACSTVDEIVLPVDAQGRYESTPGKAFGPDKLTWTYIAPKRTDFYAPFISGAQRLSNGDTLICSGTNGTVFEVTPAKETVWKYVNPAQGGPPFGGVPFGGLPFGGPPRPAEILSPFLRDMLKVTAEQKKQLDALQKEVDGELEKLLTDGQKKQLKEMRQRSDAPGFGGLPGFGPGGPPGGFGAPPGGGGLFRAPRYAPDYPGLAGKDLTPGKTIEELQAKEPPRAPGGQ